MRHLGEGSYGSVYKNKDGLACKQMQIEDNSDNILIEVDALRKFSHPNIVQYESFRVSGKHVYLYMEFCPMDLNRFIKKHGRMRESEAMTFFNQITSAIAFIHQSNLLHLDLKPDNILVTYSDQGQKVCKVADFGCSSHTTLINVQNYGSVNTRPPECFLHLFDDVRRVDIEERCGVTTDNYTKTSDVFACGLILMYMITKRFLFYPTLEFLLAPCDLVHKFVLNPKEFIDNILHGIELENETITTMHRFLAVRASERPILEPIIKGQIRALPQGKKTDSSLNSVFQERMTEFINKVVEEGHYIMTKTLLLALDLAARFCVTYLQIPSRKKLDEMIDLASVFYENGHEGSMVNCKPEMLVLLEKFDGYIVRNHPLSTAKTITEIRSILVTYMNDVSSYYNITCQDTIPEVMEIHEQIDIFIQQLTE